MADKITLTRQALLHLGSDSLLESFSEESKEAKVANIFFEDAKRASLRDYNWNFATSEKPLALYGTANGEYLYQYKYPNNCVKARKIVSPIPDLDIPFKVGSDGGVQVIKTNQEQAVLEYTEDVEISQVIDASFLEAFTLKLALMLVMPLSANASLLDRLEQRYQRALFKAETNDANEGQAEEQPVPDWIKSRF